MSIADKLLTVANNTRSVAEKVNAAKTTASGNPVVLRNTIEGEPVEIKLSSKNLFNINALEMGKTLGAAYATPSMDGERITLNVYNAASPSRVVILIPKESFIDGKQYSFQVKASATPSAVIIGEADSINDTASFSKYGRANNATSCVATIANITKPYINFYIYFAAAEVGTEFTIEDIQIEQGGTVTEYTPYTTDFTDMEVVATGKNLFNSAEPKHSGVSNIEVNEDGIIRVWQTNKNQYATANIPIPLCKNLVGKTITISCYARTLGANEAAIRVLWAMPNGGAAGSHIMTKEITGNEFTFVSKTGVVPAQPTPEHNTLALYIYSNTEPTLTESVSYAEYKDIQIEIGDSVTDYEPYKEPQTALADASGTVAGITAYSPTTTLYSTNDEIVINAAYFPESSTDTLSKYRAIKQEMQTLSDSLKEE